MLRSALPKTLLFVFCLVWSDGHAREVSVSPGTPVFRDPSTDSPVIAVLPSAIRVSSFGRRREIVATHPLVRYFYHYPILLPDGRRGWVSPFLRYGKDAGGRPVLRAAYSTPAWQKAFLGAILAGLAGVAWSLLRLRGSPPGRPDEIRGAVLPATLAGIVLLRWFFLLLCLMRSHNIITIAFDELGYFEVAKGILSGNLSGPWKYTVGQGMLYLPFVAFSGAREYYDIAVPFAWFSGFILMPACLVFLYLIVRRLTGSPARALAAALIWSATPFLHHYFQYWDEGIFKSFIALPRFTLCFRFYNILVGTGFNAMSDTPAMFLILLCIVLATHLPPRLQSLLLVSALFSLSCLIRLSNIYFGPLIAWLFWRGAGESLLRERRLALSILLCVAVFVAVFSPQFLVNYLHFGSAWTFPYILHSGAHKGFEWAFLDSGTRFLAGANHAIWVLGVLGMLFMSDRGLRVALVLWAVPLTLFFCGYNYVFADGVRFLLPTYGALIAAFVCSDIWTRTTAREKTCLLAALGGSIMLVCPSAYFWEHQLPFDLQRFAWGAKAIHLAEIVFPTLILTLAIANRRNPYLSRFYLVFLIVFFAGQPYLFLVAFTGILIVCTWTWIEDLRAALEGRSSRMHAGVRPGSEGGAMDSPEEEVQGDRKAAGEGIPPPSAERLTPPL